MITGSHETRNLTQHAVPPTRAHDLTTHDLTTGSGRLLRLADWLDGPVRARIDRPVVFDSFDLEHWVATLALEDGGDYCGTSACAVGWGTLDPLLKAQGLGRHGGLPCFVRADGIEGVGNTAAQYFFDLPVEAVDRLFMPSSYPEELSGTALLDAVIGRLRVHVLGRPWSRAA